jgi:hypothetical protein
MLETDMRKSKLRFFIFQLNILLSCSIQKMMDTTVPTDDTTATKSDFDNYYYGHR